MQVDAGPAWPEESPRPLKRARRSGATEPGFGRFDSGVSGVRIPIARDDRERSEPSPPKSRAGAPIAPAAPPVFRIGAGEKVMSAPKPPADDTRGSPSRSPTGSGAATQADEPSTKSPGCVPMHSPPSARVGAPFVPPARSLFGSDAPATTNEPSLSAPTIIPLPDASSAESVSVHEPQGGKNFPGSPAGVSVAQPSNAAQTGKSSPSLHAGSKTDEMAGKPNASPSRSLFSSLFGSVLGSSATTAKNASSAGTTTEPPTPPKSNRAASRPPARSPSPVAVLDCTQSVVEVPRNTSPVAWLGSGKMHTDPRTHPLHTAGEAGQHPLSTSSLSASPSLSGLALGSSGGSTSEKSSDVRGALVTSRDAFSMARMRQEILEVAEVAPPSITPMDFTSASTWRWRDATNSESESDFTAMEVV